MKNLKFVAVGMRLRSIDHFRLFPRPEVRYPAQRRLKMVGDSQWMLDGWETKAGLYPFRVRVQDGKTQVIVQLDPRLVPTFGNLHHFATIQPLLHL